MFLEYSRLCEKPFLRKLSIGFRELFVWKREDLITFSATGVSLTQK